MGIYVGSYSNSPASSILVFMMPPPIRSCSKCADPLRRVAAISFPFSLCQRHSLLCRRECFGKYFGILLFFSKCVYLAFNWQILQHLNCTFPGHSSWNDGSDSYHLYWLGPQIPPTSTPYPILPHSHCSPHPSHQPPWHSSWFWHWLDDKTQTKIHLETTAVTHTVYIDFILRSPSRLPRYMDISNSSPSHQPPWHSSWYFDTGWRTQQRQILPISILRTHRVRKNDNFPDSKIFVVKTFRIKRVNCVNFQICDQYV